MVKKQTPGQAVREIGHLGELCAGVVLGLSWVAFDGTKWAARRVLKGQLCKNLRNTVWWSSISRK